MKRQATRGRESLRAATLAAICLLSCRSAWGQSEYDVKAAFLFNFTKFVEWPAASNPAGAPIVIGVVGRDPFGQTLDNLVAGKVVSGHSITVRRFKWSDDTGGCEVLFVPSTDMDPGRLARLKGKPVLIVTEVSGGTRKGAIINFVIESGKVRFEIDAQAARDAGLTVSSKLLALARPAK